MSKEDLKIYSLPDLKKSPLNPYKYRCLLMKNQIRLIVISINDLPESFEGAAVNKDGELESVTKFNKAYCTELTNRDPYKLMIGADIFRDHVKSAKVKFSKNTSKKKSMVKNQRLLHHKEFVGAMALVVGVGDVSDPEQIYGMAHLTEHSVFLGSKKYPKASELFEFIKTSDGVANASTSFFNTDYFMSANTKDIYVEALDRISDMLANPILDAERIVNEVNAVDCEFTMRQRRASIGLLQILRSFTHPDNPMHRFSCGNRFTLNDPKLGEKLKNWKRRYYVGNLMTLTLVSTLSLNELEHLAVRYFSKIDEGVKINESLPWSVVKVTDNTSCPDFHNLVKVYTEKYARDLLVNFSLSPDIWKQIGVRPFRYISFLLMDRGPNGLRHFLNRKGYSVDFYAGPLEKDMCHTEFNSLFSILVVLSSKGLENYETVLEAIFAYIRMLQENKPPAWFYEEMQTFHQQKFHYAYQTNNIFNRRAMARAVKNSHAMQGVTPWRVLSASILMAHFDEQLITNTLKKLVPQRANIIITSKCFQSIVNKMEPYYKYTYLQENIPDELMTKMSTSTIKFDLPLPNQYLKLTIGRVCNSTNNYLQPARSTEIGGKATILCLQMEEPKYGLLAKTKCAMFIKSEVNDRWEPTQLEFLLQLIAYHLELEISLEHKPASGSLVKINTGTRGGTLAIFIRTPAQFFVQIFEDIFKIFYQFEKNLSDDTSFETKKERIMDSMMDKWMDDISYGEVITNYIFNENFVSYPMLKHRFAELKWSVFTKKIEEFRAKFYLTVALEGCIEHCQVEELTRVISGWTNETPVWSNIPMYPCVDNRTVMLQKGERTFRILSKLLRSEVSLIKVHYQFDQSIKQETIEKISFLLSLAAFYELRTAQHLGYYIKANPIAIGGVPIIAIEVLTRAHFFSVGYVNDRIKIFVREFYEKNIHSEKSFKALIKTKSSDYRHLDWNTIKRIFEDYMLPTGSHYRNLCIQICGSLKDPKSKPREASIPHHRTGTIMLKTYSAALGSMTLVTSNSTKKEKEKYYILNLDRYKNSLSRFPVDKSCEEEIASPFENAEGETSDEE